MTPRDRRALLAGAAVVGAALLFGRLVPVVVRHWRAGAAELADRTALLERERGDLRGIGSLEDSAKVIEARFVALAPDLLTGSTDAEGVADLEARVNLAASRHRARIVRMDQLPDTSVVARLRRVRVNVQVESDWGGIVEFLRALDDDPAALSVGALSVSAADPVTSSARPEILRADLEISAWYLQAGSDRIVASALSSRGHP